VNIYNQSVIGADKFIITYRDQDTLEIRNRRGWASLFGLPFLLGGLFVLQIPLGIVPLQAHPYEPLALFLMALIGGGNSIGGICIMLGRRGILLDRRRGRMIQWWGLLAPMKRSICLLNPITQVEMKFDSGSSDGAATWPITLRCANIGKPVTVVEPTGYAEAKRVARELSRFLGKPLVDSSTGGKITCEPEFLDESYADRIRRTAKTVGVLPPKPSKTRLELRRTKEGFVLYIPESAKGRIHYLPLLFSIAFSIFMAGLFVPHLTFPVKDSMGYFLTGLVAFFVGAPILGGLLILRSGKRQFERITVTTDMLRVESLEEGVRATAEIPFADLKELVAPSIQESLGTGNATQVAMEPAGNDASPRSSDRRRASRPMQALIKMSGSRGIIARSDTDIITFARDLDEAEVAWIYSLIHQTITAAPAQAGASRKAGGFFKGSGKSNFVTRNSLSSSLLWLFIGAAIATIGVSGFISVVGRYWTDVKIIQSGARVSASVTEKTACPSCDGSPRRIQYEFQLPDGTRIRGTDEIPESKWRALNEGDEVSVLCLPDNPRRNFVEGRKAPVLSYVIVMGGLTAIMAIFGGLIVFSFIGYMVKGAFRPEAS